MDADLAQRRSRAARELFAWLSFALPLWLTAARLDGAARFGVDEAVLQSLDPAVCHTGHLSAALGRLTALVPFGSLSFRFALAGALAAGVAGRLCFGLALSLLEWSGGRRMAPVLALAAATAAVMSAPWQLEAFRPGGSAVSGALLLGLVAVQVHGAERPWAKSGLLLGALLAEGLAGFFGGLVLVGLFGAASGNLPRRAEVLQVLAATAGAWTLLALPAVLASGPSALVWAARQGTPALPHLPEPGAAWTGWVAGAGVIGLALGAVGLAGFALTGRQLLAAALGAALLSDLVLCRTGALTEADAAPSSLTAVALIVVLAAAGVQRASDLVGGLRVPFARGSGVLLRVALVTLALVAVEDSGHLLGASRTDGAQAWTNEALGRLPPDSLVIVHSKPVAARLLAAQRLRGERPDVLVVPLELLENPVLARPLIQAEPGLGALVRDVTVAGRPSEYALSSLAERRPMFLELYPAWDRRLMEQLVPGPFWLKLAPHALGRSDRVAALERGRAGYRRVLAAAQSGVQPDRATLAVLFESGRQQATVLLELRDERTARGVLEDLRQIDPEHPVVQELERRLGLDDIARLDRPRAP